MDLLLSALLRGEQTRWPFADEADAERFLDAARHHLVQPLVARLIRRGVLTDAPPIVCERLARAAVQQAAIHECLAAETRRVVEALARAGVPSLVMKGAALAYTHYPHPCLRPRTDTDLLIRARDADRAFRVLASLRYDALDMTRGDLILHQRTYAKEDSLGIRHVYDVHWKVAAPQIVADVVQWDDLYWDAQRIPALGDRARALGDAHALLLACVHRMAHHYDSASLIWLYDIHLLASRLDDDALREFMRLAEHRAAGAMCARGLGLAYERFGTALPAGVLEALHGRRDESATAFGAEARPVDVLLSDLKALPGWPERLQLLQQHLIPPADYIRRRYGVSGSFVLPILYAHRCVTGVRKWLSPAARDTHLTS